MSAEFMLIIIGCYWIFMGWQISTGQRTTRETRAKLTEENWKAWTAKKGRMNMFQGFSWIILAFAYIFSVSVIMLIAGAGIIGALIGEAVVNKKYLHKFLAM